MDLEALLYRPAIAGAPISLLLPLGRQTIDPELLDRAVSLLRETRGSEVLLILAQAPPDWLPARRQDVRIRYQIDREPESGAAWERAIRASRGTIVVMSDSRVSLTPSLLKDFLDRLDGCDLVVGRRETSWSAKRWVGVLLRWLFAVPGADPWCPIRVFRRSAVADVPLQSDGPWVLFEMLAKLTYFSALVDEQMIPVSVGPAAGPPLAMPAFVFRPKFWQYPARFPRPDPLDSNIPGPSGNSRPRRLTAAFRWNRHRTELNPLLRRPNPWTGRRFPRPALTPRR